MAFRILYNPASDVSGVTITSSSDGSSNTDDNVVNNRIGKKWRTTSDTAEWIKFDLGSAQAVSVAALLGHNLTASATVYLQGNATDSWGAPTIDELVTIGTDSDSNVLPRIVHFIASTSLRYWRITIDDPTNPDAYIQVGRIIFGAYYETSRHISADLRVEHLDPSEGQKVPGEVPIVTAKTSFRRIRTSFRLVDATETKKWATIFRHIGQHKPALICWDETDANEDSAYVYLATSLDLAHQFVGYHDIAALLWEEKTR